jgi:hypothetical protein
VDGRNVLVDKLRSALSRQSTLIPRSKTEVRLSPSEKWDMLPSPQRYLLTGSSSTENPTGRLLGRSCLSFLPEKGESFS